MANDNKERIGIVGTGRMGLAMLKHLVKRGYTVTACDVSAKALETARAAGGATADTPAALAKQCDSKSDFGKVVGSILSERHVEKRIAIRLLWRKRHDVAATSHDASPNARPRYRSSIA